MSTFEKEMKMCGRLYCHVSIRMTDVWIWEMEMCCGMHIESLYKKLLQCCQQGATTGNPPPSAPSPLWMNVWDGCRTPTQPARNVQRFWLLDVDKFCHFLRPEALFTPCLYYIADNECSPYTHCWPFWARGTIVRSKYILSE